MLRHLIGAVSAAGSGERLRARGLGAAIALCVTGVAATPASAAAVPATAMVATLPAPTATLREVGEFGPNPTDLRMYLYVPARVRPRPAVVVAVHYCTGSGPELFGASQFASLADRYGFIVGYPSAPRARHCFDVSTPGALTREGNRDPVGIGHA